MPPLFHRETRLMPISTLRIAREITSVDLEECERYPETWNFAPQSAAVLQIQLEQLDAEIHRRERLTLPPVSNGGPDAEAVKAKVDIIQIVERYTNLRKAGRTYRGKCPVHDGVSDGSLAV
jgi:CHC2 zinc finger